MSIGSTELTKSGGAGGAGGRERDLSVGSAELTKELEG